MRGLSWQDFGHISLALAAMLAVSGPAVATTVPEITRIAGLDVAVWRPAGDGGKHPLILFSHGWSGCKTQSGHLMAAFAAQGMLVMAPDHEDNGCTTGLRLPLPRELLTPETWTEDRYPNRAQDITGLLAAAKSDARYGPLIDARRVALVGHSLGGYTMLGLAGAWPGPQIEGLAAVVALAPYAATFKAAGELDRVITPMLFQAGDQDDAARLSDVQAVFARVTAPRCMVVFGDAGHFAWVDREALPAWQAGLTQPQFQGAIAAAAVAFLQEVFDGQPIGARLLSLQTPPADCEPATYSNEEF
jgi:predicted dienelactone hydrolase